MAAGYVVCVGLATRDTIMAVPSLPAPDGRVVASELATAGGGPAATAAVTLARLGISVSFVGAVGDDDAGAAIVSELEREGIDVSELMVVPGARSPQSMILVQPSRRAIAHYPGVASRLELGRRAVALCRGAAWVHVDHAGYAAVPRDVRLSIDAGNPIEALDVRGVALYAPTQTALRQQFGDPEGALRAGADLVVVTRGESGSAAYGRDGTFVDAPGRPVNAVSTLGAGDVFHGALLAQLVRERPLSDSLEVANECAALACRALDARSAIPTLAEVSA